MKKLVILVFLSFIFSISFAQELDKFTLYKKGASFEEIKNDKNTAVKWLKYSPNNKSRFSTTAYDRTEKRKDKWGHGIYDLLIFDNDSLVFSTEGVFSGHCWNQEGTKLAYINGEFDGADRMDGNSVWIYDVEKEELIPVVTGLQEQYLRNLNWAEYDGNLYVQSLQIGDKVYIVDIEEKKLIETEYHATNFSPDGKFYYDGPLEGEKGDLYKREANELIWSNYPEHPFLNMFVNWSKNKKGETLLYITGTFNEAVIYNCEIEELKFFKSPQQKLMIPVFEGNNVRWETDEQWEEFLKKQKEKGRIKK